MLRRKIEDRKNVYVGGYNFIGQFRKASVGNDICVKLKEWRAILNLG